MTLEASEYSLIVVGAMNPQIHHPTWYRTANLIGADAEEVALKNRDLVCTPQLSAFQTSVFRVTCLQERWEMVTNEREHLGKLVEMAGGVFDAKLNETPINAFDLNFRYHRKTEIANVASEFTDLFTALPFDIDELGVERVSFSTEGQSGDRKTKTTIEPSVKSDDMIYLAFNFHYETRGKVEGAGHFALGPMVKEARESDEHVADELCARIINALNSQ